MVFKRAGSKVWYLGPLRAGGVDVPRLSTGVRDKLTATAIERSLHELAVTGWADLVERVARKELGLVELYTAKLLGREKLEEVRRAPDDPPLTSVIARLEATTQDERVLVGFKQMARLAPKDARLSWLRTPQNVTGLYLSRAGEGVKPNSIRRSLHRAVAELLTRELGRGQMLAVMADVMVPSAQDERRAILTVEEARAALEAADEEFQPVLGYALTTGIDRLPMTIQRVRDFDEAEGTLYVPDTKAKDRERTLSLRGEPVLENAEFWLRQLIAGKAPGEPLIPITERQVRSRWEGVRKEIGREDLRWKDLRGVFATYHLLAGGEPRELQAILGHSGMAMTLRYLRRRPAGNRDRLREQARKFGTLSDAGHLKAEKRGSA